jgi:uncharacterized membrane protein YfcA
MDEPTTSRGTAPTGATPPAGLPAASPHGTWRVVLVGLAAGFLSGLFGVGGGILMVPALVLVLGMGQRLAHGTSLAAIVPIATAGVVGYAVAGELDVAVAVCLVAGSATVGAPLGTYLLRIMPIRLLAGVFSLVMLATAVHLVAGDAEAPGRGDLTLGTVLALVAVGVLAGTLSGLLGVGGGVITVPALIVLIGLPAVVAKGSSLLVIIPTAAVGTQRNRAHDNVDLRVALVLGLSGLVSSYAASQLSVELDERLSNRLFAALLIVVAVKLAWDNRPRRYSVSR